MFLEVIRAFNSEKSTYVSGQRVSKFVIICLSYGQRESGQSKFVIICLSYGQRESGQFLRHRI